MYGTELPSVQPLLAEHWRKASELSKAIVYLSRSATCFEPQLHAP